MATLTISGRINKTYECEFDYKGNNVVIEISDTGGSLKLYKNGDLISDQSGDCHDWKFTGHLHGAASKQATIGDMRQHAIYLLENEVEVDE